MNMLLACFVKNSGVADEGREMLKFENSHGPSVTILLGVASAQHAVPVGGLVPLDQATNKATSRGRDVLPVTHSQATI